MDVQHPLCKGNLPTKKIIFFKNTFSGIAKIVSYQTDADNDSRDTSTEKQGMSKTYTQSTQ